MSTSSCSATTARPAQRSAWPTSRSGRSSRWKPGPTSGQDDTMLGQAIIVLVLVVGIPVSVMMTGAVVAGILGWALKANGEAVKEGSEIIDLNVCTPRRRLAAAPRPGGRRARRSRGREAWRRGQSVDEG